MSNTPSVGISIRLAPEMLARLEALAARERRSRSQLIGFAIEAYLKQHEAQETAGGTVTIPISPHGCATVAAEDDFVKERKK